MNCWINTHQYSKMLKPETMHVLLTLFLLILATGFTTPGMAQSNGKITKQIDGPELKGPIAEGTDKAPETAPIQKDRKPDLAYGAFQRGYYLTALKLALPRAEAGDPAAQTLIAEIYWNGLGVAINRKEAAAWYKFAADGGNPSAQFSYANILLRGLLVDTDTKTGRELMEKAAEAGNIQAQFNLAQIITASRPTWAGFKNALPWYEKAAKAGLPDAQYALSNIYAEAKGVVTTDEEKARLWLKRAAEGGLDTAQVEYGVWLVNGRGGPKNENEAFVWFQRAAAQRNVLAQNRLSRMYAYGIGTKQDPIKAAAWHILARRAGYKDNDMDQRFSAYTDIDKRRSLELANRLGS